MEFDRALELIDLRISKGHELLRPFVNPADLSAADAEYSIWDATNTEVLVQICTTRAFAQDYNVAGAGVFWGSTSFAQDVRAFESKVRRDILRLEAIKQRIITIREIDGMVSPGGSDSGDRPESVDVPGSREVFVVHGRDEATREQVARFLEHLGLTPVILAEQANEGQTLLEKFVAHSDVAFAVVLLTGDDSGYLTGEPESVRPRARQNVIFELGFFIGRLDRAKVCALYEESVELPSDINGWLHVPLDSAGAWKMLLGREMKAAGLKIDMNKAL